MTKRFDFVALACVILILLAGLSTIYSIGATSGEPILSRQLVALAIGAAFYLVAAFFDYRLLASYSRYFYVGSLILLAVVLFVSTDVRGANRWIPLGGFNLQPVELAKIALIILLARFFAHKRGEIKNARVIVHSAILMLAPVLLVMLQPDLGSSLLLFFIWIALLLFTPVKRAHIAALLLVFVLVAAGGWFGFLHDYQKQRIVTFMNPEADPQGSGYNVRQAIIAVGSGEFDGKGLGRGQQSHLRFLPERHTDFIFASYAEELGFMGSFALLAAFGILFIRMVLTALRAVDSVGMYICLGVAVLIMAQVFINIGMNVGLMPVTGITLPLVSYGGSSLIATLFMLGLVQSVYRRSKIVL